MNDLLKNGLLLMIIGMGTVFSFLAIMVCCIKVSALFAAKFSYLLPDPEPQKTKKKPAAKKPAASDGELVAVIGAAIAKFRAGK